MDGLTKKSDLGVIGLAVMGENLILNIESNGYTVSVFNRTTTKVTDFVEGRASGKNIKGTLSLEEFVDSLSKPRKIILMVKAGDAVDSTISNLIQHLDDGDIIIDGGNSNYKDTQRRAKELSQKNILYVGTGISGGEEGALKGPSIMPGGNKEAWNHIEPILKAISAKAGPNNDEPCCEWIGESGAGHFVKMVHNGIEYGDMQLISEAYHILKEQGHDNKQLSEIFEDWNNGKLKSYLIEITARIFEHKEGEEYTIDKILDTAGQKGTGRWTAIESLENGVHLTLITESVFARIISSLINERVEASKEINLNVDSNSSIEVSLEDLENALYIAKLVSYAQGFSLMKSASDEYGWDINYGDVASIWRNGCIIRSVFLEDITEAYSKNEKLKNILLAEKFKQEIEKHHNSLRKVISAAVQSGIPVPAMSAALSYLDSYTKKRLPANLIQAQRDFFGAHTYERTDKPRKEFFHTNWTGEGGNTHSSTYNN